jgi:hypothetical protein
MLPRNGPPHLPGVTNVGHGTLCGHQVVTLDQLTQRAEADPAGCTVLSQADQAGPGSTGERGAWGDAQDCAWRPLVLARLRAALN